MTAKNTASCFTIALNEEQTERLRDALTESCWELSDGDYCHFKARKEKTSLAMYRSGKLVVQGAGTSDFVEFILEPQVLLRCLEKPEEEPFSPHAGIDESGKGDFFGPLVVAAVYVPDESAALDLMKYGVKDSKLIKNDQTILAVASKIRARLGDRMGMVTIGPEAYNRIYHAFGSLNRLLAWGHARALENLLNNVPECTSALADQFGDEHLILNALNEKGRKIRLDQRTKAESDIAVAAASIMARAQFVRIMEKLGSEQGVSLPKGAGPAVDEIAAQLFQKGGAELLGKTAKMHFRNAYKAQGLPMPEKKAWTPHK